MEETLTQVWTILVEIVTNLLNPDAWRRVLEKPEVFWAAFIAVTLIVFTETGLLVGFFLPGDSLLVTVGMVGKSVGWPIEYLVPALWAAARPCAAWATIRLASLQSSGPRALTESPTLPPERSSITR